MTREITFFHGSKYVTIWSRAQRSHVYHVTPASMGRLGTVLGTLHQLGLVESRPTFGTGLGVNFKVWDAKSKSPSTL